MKTVALRVLIVSLLGIFFTVHSSQDVFAQLYSHIEIPLHVLNENKPVQIQGLISSVSLDLNIPKSYLPANGSWLSLLVEASPLLDMERSSLTIILNGLQVTSLKISQLKPGAIQVELPVTMIKRGANTLTFTGTLYLTYDKESDCTNWNDPARWLNLAPDSLVHLGLEPADASFDLSDFPFAFANPLENYLPTMGAALPLVILPDSPTRDDLSNLVAVAYAIGSQATSSQNWQPEVISESEFDRSLAVNRHLVFINAFPPELGQFTSAGKDLVALQSSPWDPAKAMLVIADHDRKDGFSPAQVFSDPVQRVILNANMAYLDPPASAPALPGFKNKYTFEELGYLDRTVRGIGDGNLTYRFFLPYGVAARSAMLNLVVTHAPDLNTSTSTITIFVNGYTVAGILPNARSASLAPIQVNIPAARFRPGVNFIRISFNLQAAFTSCERTPNAVWATVLRQTSLETDFFFQNRAPSLEYFPMPFSDNPAGVFVLPDQPDNITLGHVAGLAFQFGQAALLTERPPVALRASEFAIKASASPYIILVGAPAQNSAIMAINDLLPQPFSPDGTVLAKGYGIFAPTAQQPADLGLLQILSSPWNEDGVVLVVTGLGEQGLEWTWDVLLDPAQWPQFTGSLMIAGSQQRIIATGKTEGGPAVFQTTANVSHIPVVGNYLQGIRPDNLVPAAVSMIAALVLVLLLLFIVQFGKRVYR